MISSWSERMIGHTGTETRPRVLQEATVGNLLQWVKDWWSNVTWTWVVNSFSHCFPWVTRVINLIANSLFFFMEMTIFPQLLEFPQKKSNNWLLYTSPSGFSLSLLYDWGSLLGVSTWMNVTQNFECSLGSSGYFSKKHFRITTIFSISISDNTYIFLSLSFY